MVIRSRYGGKCGHECAKLQESEARFSRLGAVGEENARIGNLTEQLRVGDYAGKPSTGMRAFVTFGSICDSVSLYGFEEDGMLDGRNLKTDHSLNAENALVRKIAEGRVLEEDFPIDLRADFAAKAIKGKFQIRA